MKSLLVCFVGLLVSVHASPVSPPVVSGQVRLADGSPVAGAQVVLFDVADLGRGAVGQATTDEAGQFALPLTAASAALVLPQGFALGPNYPNPFNPSTIIPYQLAATSPVRLEVFNVLGQHMATLVDGEQAAGSYRVRWDGTDAAGRAAASGVYFYRLTVDGAQQTGKMVLTDGQAGVPLGGPSVAVVSLASGSAGSYGLVVSGAGLVAYVDADFGVEVGPVDLVVETQPQARGKVVVPTLEGMLGDVDNSGHVDLDDGLLVAMHRVDPTLSLPNHGSIGLGDVDCNGRVERADATLLATYVVDPSDPAVSSLRIGQRGGYSLNPVTETVWGSILGTEQQDATVARLLDAVPVLVSGVFEIDGRDHLYLGIDRAYYQRHGGEPIYNALKQRFPITPLFVEASDGVQQPARRPQAEPVPPIPFSESPNQEETLPTGIGAGKAHSSDQAVLVALYEATDGDHWTNNTHWLSEKPLEDWFGVTTDENGRVTRLDLRVNGLRGSIPPALGQLQNLTYLNLRSNQLSDSIPQGLGQLHNLEKLYLYDNQLSGSIPPALGQLQNLTHLSLRVNGLRGSIPQALGQLQNLTYLNLRSNQLSGSIPQALGQLQNLEKLYLYDNQLSGSIPPALGQLHNLTHLNLRDNPLRGSLPASLVNLTSLAWLVVEDTQVCVPTDAGFQAWLEGIENKRGVVHCTADGDGSDSATPDATSEDETPEPNETSNLTVSSLFISPDETESGTQVTARIIVKNDGTASAGSETVHLYRHRTRTSNPTSGGSRLATTATTGSLVSGAQVTKTIIAAVPSVTSDITYYYYACVSAADGEVATGNNCSSPAEVSAYPSTFRSDPKPPYEHAYAAPVRRTPMGGDAMRVQFFNVTDGRRTDVVAGGTITLGGVETADGVRGFIASAHVVADSRSSDISSDSKNTLIGHDSHRSTYKLRHLLGKVFKMPSTRTEGNKKILSVDAAFVKYPNPQTPSCSLKWQQDDESFCLDDTDQDNYIDRISPLTIRGRDGDVYKVIGSKRPTKGLKVTYSGVVTGPSKKTGSVNGKALGRDVKRNLYTYSYTIVPDLGSIPGDSGAPIYTIPDTNGNVHIVGVNEATFYSDTLGMVMLFPSWDEVVKELNLKPISP